MLSTAVFATISPLTDLFRDLLDVSLTGVILYTPLYDSAGEIVDFTFVYLNPAAQRMMAMPEQPTVTHTQQWPQSKAHGTFDFHVEAFVSGEPRHYDVNYQADGYDNYYRLAARRSGEGLLVSFTDTADQPRTPVEVVLREARVREQAELVALTQRQAKERQSFHAVFEQTPALIALLRAPGHRFEYVNPAYHQLFPGRVLVGREFADAVPEAQEQGFGVLMDRVYQTGETYFGAEVPFVVEPLEGASHTHYYNFTYQAYREEGRIAGISIFAFEVTGQVLARQQHEALQAQVLAATQRRAEERALLYQVFEETPALICILRGPEHRYEYFNAAYQRQYADRALTGRTVAEALPEAVTQGFVALIDRVYQTGETYFGLELLLTLEQLGDSVSKSDYYNLTYQAFREDGQVVGVSVFAYIVTEQVRARQDREAQRQQLQRLFMQAPAAISILAGSDLRYELVNPVYQSLFPGRELQDRFIAEALPELAGTGVLEAFHRVYHTGRTHEEKGILVQLTNHATGRLEDRYFNYIQQARRDARGQVDGVLVFAFEVTEQVRARQSSEASARQARVLADELGHSNEQLTRTNTDLDNFIYIASHDLKAPIANIEGLLQTLRDELPGPSPTEEVAHILELMEDSVERFKKTIEHLTDVSKLQKEHDQPTSQVPLAPVIEDVRLDLAPLLQQAAGRLLVDVRAVPAVTFSEKNLRSVVYNLLSNALKYHHPDRVPEVRVSARFDGPYAVLDVQDNGLGFEASQQDQLFAMFQRLHTHVGGSGLGLYMVKRMVENAGGKIAVRSEVGVGSTFSVYFVADPGAASPVSPV